MIRRALVLMTFTVAFVLACSTTPIRTGDDGVAAKGYDVVAYYTEERAIEGVPEYSHDWRGATWYFTSSDHRDRFAGDPERYAPAYGGWCAWALAEGRLAAGDPEYWAVHDERLYFNCNQAAQDNWDADRDGNIARADEYWPDIARGH